MAVRSPNTDSFRKLVSAKRTDASRSHLGMVSAGQNCSLSSTLRPEHAAGVLGPPSHLTQPRGAACGQRVPPEELQIAGRLSCASDGPCRCRDC